MSQFVCQDKCSGTNVVHAEIVNVGGNHTRPSHNRERAIICHKPSVRIYSYIPAGCDCIYQCRAVGDPDTIQRYRTTHCSKDYLRFVEFLQSNFETSEKLCT